MASLLDMLFGSQGASNGAPHQWGYDQNGYLTPQLNGGGAPVSPQGPSSPPQTPPQAPQGQPGAFVQSAAQQAPTGPLLAAATNPQPGDPNNPNPSPTNSGPMGGPAPSNDPNQNITVSGDSWHPKHAGVLGQIADYFLGTHFGRNTVRENMEGALQNLTSDPIGAVKRMAQFDPQGAEALYSQVMREQHQAAMEKHQGDVYGNMAENQAMTVARNMAMTATPENAAAVQMQMKKYLQAKGVNPALIDTLPDPTGSPDDFKTFAQGGVPAGRQAALVEAARNHDLQNARGEESIGERRDFHGQLIPILRQNAGTNSGRLNETISNDTANQGMRQEGIDAKPPGRSFQDTPYGRGETSADGMQMRITPNDPRLDQSKMHIDPKTKQAYIMYDNVGTAKQPKWRLRH